MIVIPPAPGRPSSWRTFMRAHWGAIVGAEFFTTGVWTSCGLVPYCTLFGLDLKSRRVQIVGSTRNSNAAFMAQAGQRWTDGFRSLREGAGMANSGVYARE